MNKKDFSDKASISNNKKDELLNIIRDLIDVYGFDAIVNELKNNKQD